ncbi:hypothetical protein EYC84_004858 [Monilinia fructicola]|uniref:Amino acid transporter transmembrane domain-containing protein n=1 Tax=Monilinia fructicola TaxID=38448 RepID=A0A5M9K1S5_MONFR|nr:hypothetical protein EYC84_004858 [Monilinia fructicola]
MAQPLANLALEGGDPRDPHHPIRGDATAVELAMLSAIHDPSISFEEYVYWAEITRAEEKIANEKFITAQGPRSWKSTIKNRFSRTKATPESYDSPPATTLAANEKDGLDEKSIVPGESDGSPRSAVSEAEWKRASRAVRTAVFHGLLRKWATDRELLYTLYLAYLLCTPAGKSTTSISRLIRISTLRNLMVTSSFVFSVLGLVMESTLPSPIQLLFTVSILILSNGQSISQISKGNLCFVVCLVVFMAAGMILGQIRTLQRFGWLANFAVWINVLIIFICMGVVANSAPNYATVEASFGDTFGPGPVHRYAGTPPAGKATGGDGFVGSLNGLNQAVYSYGGAMLFVAFLAEMRHPMDFWKGLLCADLFIYFVYMFFGIFVYSYQGQFSYNPVIQGLSPYNWQTAANIMNLITGLIAAVLYGNIGIKVAYVDVFQGILKAPPLTSKPGKLLWIAMVPFYWAIAFVVLRCHPAIFLHFRPCGSPLYSSIHIHIPCYSRSFDPQTGTYNYIDRGVKRWIRGFKVNWLFNIFNFLYFLGALTTAALGIYSSCLGLISAFDGSSAATSFEKESVIDGCVNTKVRKEWVGEDK